MRILLLGSGGREHTLAWKIAQSPHCDHLYIAPGNAGTAQCGQNVDISVTDFEKIGTFCDKNDVEMVVVGPEVPLVKGIVDYFASNELLEGISVIGPDKQGAMLEGSKDFAKKFMHQYDIPTARYKTINEKNIREGNRRRCSSS